MTTRTPYARETAELLARDIKGFAGPDFVEREDAQAFVASAEAAFLIALSAWEADGTEEAHTRMNDKYDGVWCAWQRALLSLPETQPKT